MGIMKLIVVFCLFLASALAESLVLTRRGHRSSTGGGGHRSIVGVRGHGASRHAGSRTFGGIHRGRTQTFGGIHRGIHLRGKREAGYGGFTYRSSYTPEPTYSSHEPTYSSHEPTYSEPSYSPETTNSPKLTYESSNPYDSLPSFRRGGHRIAARSVRASSYSSPSSSPLASVEARHGFTGSVGTVAPKQEVGHGFIGSGSSYSPSTRYSGSSYSPSTHYTGSSYSPSTHYTGSSYSPSTYSPSPSYSSHHTSTSSAYGVHRGKRQASFHGSTYSP